LIFDFNVLVLKSGSEVKVTIELSRSLKPYQIDTLWLVCVRVCVFFKCYFVILSSQFVYVRLLRVL